MFIAAYLGTCAASAASACACCTLSAISREMTRRSARLAYSFLFFLAIVLSWIMRDFARPLIEKIPCEFCWGGGGVAAARNGERRHVSGGGARRRSLTRRTQLTPQIKKRDHARRVGL